MLHARPDYNRIQDPENKIPEDEPVFLLRAQDVCAPAALDRWIQAAEDAGVDEEMIATARVHLKRMSLWALENGNKVPDMPPGY